MSDLDAKLQRRIQRYGWDKSAAHYERYWAEHLAPVQRRLLELAALRPGTRVLDVASGPGLVTFPAADAVGPTGAVLGTDLSEAMVLRGRETAQERGLTNARFERMDAEALALADSSFDVALCSLGLMYVPDPERAIAEMHRLLVPGGRLVASVWGRRDHCGWAAIFPIVDARVESQVCPLFFRLGTGETLATALQQAGFQDVEMERLPTTLHFTSAEEACGAAFRGGPVALAYARFDQSTRDAVHREYLDSLARYQDGGGYAVPGEFVLASGVRR